MERLRITLEGSDVDIGYWIQTPEGLKQTARKVTIRENEVSRLIAALQTFHQLVSREKAKAGLAS